MIWVLEVAELQFSNKGANVYLTGGVQDTVSTCPVSSALPLFSVFLIFHGGPGSVAVVTVVGCGLFNACSSSEWIDSGPWERRGEGCPMQGGRSVRDESLLPTAGTKAIVKLPSCQTEVPSPGKLSQDRKTSWKFQDPIDIHISSLTPL